MVRMPHWPNPLWHNTIQLGLERTEQLLALLGNPHLALPPVVHVAGTNGKGSTLAFLRAILEAAGLRVHVYTSPHLVRFNERIRLAGRDIDDDTLYVLLERCRLAAESANIQVTFFEGTTVAAFLGFAETPADVVLLETGLGGRLDSTNVVPNPALTVLTPIAFDHMAFLGASIAAIAFEKACIMKRGTPCVVSLQEDEAQQVIEQVANEKHVSLSSYGYEWGVHIEPDQSWLYQWEQGALHLPAPSLVGDHQYLNAATAVASVLQLRSKFSITDEAIAKGISTAYWPGRLQKVTSGALHDALPKAQGWRLWMDGAHNPAGAAMLSGWLSTQERPIYAISGMTKGRNITDFFSPLTPYLTAVYGLTVEAEPSSYEGKEVVAAVNALGLQSHLATSLEQAIKDITTHEEPGLIVICGSLYLVGHALAINEAKREEAVMRKK